MVVMVMAMVDDESLLGEQRGSGERQEGDKREIEGSVTSSGTTAGFVGGADDGGPGWNSTAEPELQNRHPRVVESAGG